MEKLIHNFLWSHGGESKHFNLISWSKVPKDKDEGGLGFFCLRDVRKAILGKLLFRLINNKEELWVQWIFSSNNLKEDFWNHSKHVNSSLLIKEIYKAGLGLREGIYLSLDNNYK